MPEAPGEVVEPELPVESFREAARHLRRPFTPAAVKFKVQATWPTGGLIVAYIDARLAVERLNLIVPHLWHDEYRAVRADLMWCDLTVDGITRSDVGEGTGKGLVSDALKRAAVKFGVGVSLYAIPKMMLNNEHLDRKQRGGKEQVTLTDAGERHVRGLYAAWLDQHGRAAFGDPLNHGDVEGAQGDHEAEAEPEASEPTPSPVQTISEVEAKGLYDEAQTARIPDDKLLQAIAHVSQARASRLEELTGPQALKLGAWLEKKGAEAKINDAGA